MEQGIEGPHAAVRSGILRLFGYLARCTVGVSLEKVNKLIFLKKTLRNELGVVVPTLARIGIVSEDVLW